MTITARVHNHSIVLPPEVVVAEGAEVQVIVPAVGAAAGETPDWLRRSVGVATSGLKTDEIMRMTRGED
jgi:hypothetical protein